MSDFSAYLGLDFHSNSKELFKESKEFDQNGE